VRRVDEAQQAEAQRDVAADDLLERLEVAAAQLQLAQRPERSAVADRQRRVRGEVRALVEEPLEEIEAGVAEDLERVLGVDAASARAR
jgi:hypothetical protein